MISYRCKPFYELTAPQLYSIMTLRQEVFIVEQNCAYLDADGKDLKGYHLTGYDDDGKLVAYARLLPKGVSYDNFVSIGRVVTSPSVRGTGAGQSLMKEALNCMDALFPGESIKLGGQSYLRNFYESFGFVVSGEEYLEDDIPHLPMVR
ncbi:MAG: GNAT family N-acetyltransferase [Saprospiraceae bacterium]|nr:GNAT family N-acetyltransferase [Saprospiraceae bacterium]